MIMDDIDGQALIRAERFALRPLRQEDAGAVGLHMSDERVARATATIPHPLPPGAAEAHVARALDPDTPEVVWVIDGDSEGGRGLLGLISLTRLDRDQSQLSYWVAPAFWNAGIASEAVNALMQANPLGNKEVFAEVFQDNPASARVLTNAGFQYIGDAEAHSIARGANVPTWTYIRKMG